MNDAHGMVDVRALRRWTREEGDWSEPRLCVLNGLQYVVVTTGRVAVLAVADRVDCDGATLTSCYPGMWQHHLDAMRGAGFRELTEDEEALLESQRDCDRCCGGVVTEICPTCDRDWDRECTLCEGTGVLFGGDRVSAEIDGLPFELQELASVYRLPGFRFCVFKGTGMDIMRFLWAEGWGLVCQKRSV